MSFFSLPKILLMVILLSSLVVAGVTFTGGPGLNATYVSPTPANATESTTRYFEVNVSLDNNNLNQVFYDWNGTNYTIYNSSLILMLNFDNTSVEDVSLLANNVTESTTALITQGKYKQARGFNGGNSFIRVHMHKHSTLKQVHLPLQHGFSQTLQASKLFSVPIKQEHHKILNSLFQTQIFSLVISMM